MDRTALDLILILVLIFILVAAAASAKPAAWIAPRATTSVAALVLLLLHATAGLAQDDAKVRAGLETWRSSGCVDCHGPFADGERGTGMPSFDGDAYTARACYGRPLGAPPDNLQPTPRRLSLEEIDGLVAYLQARIVGHGKVTRQECLSYFEDKADCDDFK